VKVERICKACGKSWVANRADATWYCSRSCYRKTVEHPKVMAKKRASGIRVVGGTDNCVRCGEVFTIKGRKSNKCETCRRDVRLELYRDYNASPVRKDKLKDRRQNDPKYAMDRRMGWAVWNSLKREGKGDSWENLVGFGVPDLVKHLERQFTDGMSWDNMGEWHVDHIIPLASFEYSSAEDEGFRAAWSITNLRPLWAKENVSKGAQRLLLI